MANHGYIHTDSPITDEQLWDLLQEVNNERFGGKLVIEKGEDCFGVKISEYTCRLWWVDEDDDTTIEHRHGGGGDIAWWIDAVFSDEIAVKLDGLVEDDGCEGREPGQSGKYPTLRSYLEMKWSHSKQGADRVAYLICGEMKMALEEAPNLAEFIGELPEVSDETEKQMKAEGEAFMEQLRVSDPEFAKMLEPPEKPA